MSHLDKNIVITPNVGNANDDPKIVFSSANTTANAQNITMRTYPTSNGTLSIEGSAGQLFSITNQLSGSLFSVNDISGIPSIEVLDTGRVSLAQYGGNVIVGSNTAANASTSNTTGGLIVYGGIGVTGNIYVGGTNAGANGIYTDVLRYAANGLPWVMGSGGGGSGGNTIVTLSGYIANTILVANSTGYLSNSNAYFISSNNTVLIASNTAAISNSTGALIVNGGVGISGNVFVSNSLSVIVDSGAINRPFSIRGAVAGVSGAQFGVVNEALDYYTSGGYSHWFATNGPRTTLQFGITNTSSAVNWMQVTGSVTNKPTILSSAGSDANVAISLTPKGNGSVMITGNTTSTINVANSLYVGGVVGFANANNISVVYQSYNSSTNSLDVVFG